MKKRPQYKIVNVRGFYKIHEKTLLGWKPLTYILTKKLTGEGSRWGKTESWSGEYGDSCLEDTEKLLKVIQDEPYHIFESISYTDAGVATGSGRVVLVPALKAAGLSTDGV
jgi:hypothetical protein